MFRLPRRNRHTRRLDAGSEAHSNGKAAAKQEVQMLSLEYRREPRLDLSAV